MKAVVQRVMAANVTVNGVMIGSIGRGLCIFIRLTSSDTATEINHMVREILTIKLFEEEEGDAERTQSVVDKQYEILCLSQFTLYDSWKAFYDEFVQVLRSMYLPEKIIDGHCGTYMDVCIENDGPLTVEIESPDDLAEEAEARDQAGPSHED